LQTIATGNRYPRYLSANPMLRGSVRIAVNAVPVSRGVEVRI